MRLFAYGSLSVILVFYLVSIGLTEAQVGILLTLTLLGDLLISLLLTTRADGANLAEPVTSSVFLAKNYLACKINILALVGFTVKSGTQTEFLRRTLAIAA